MTTDIQPKKNIQTEKIIFRNVYEYTYAYMYIITIKREYGFEKEKGWYTGGIQEGLEKGKRIK